jgi:hypothetical protein
MTNPRALALKANSLVFVYFFRVGAIRTPKINKSWRLLVDFPFGQVSSPRKANSTTTAYIQTQKEDFYVYVFVSVRLPRQSRSNRKAFSQKKREPPSVRKPQRHPPGCS